MLRAIIFDFNGILIDDEPVHFELFRKVLKEKGIGLTKKEYYARYLGMDDRGCFKATYQDHGLSLDDLTLVELVQRKALFYRRAMEKGLALFPAVKELIPSLAGSYPLAIASGALRNEIETILKGITLRNYFEAVVSAEDVKDGKPSPEVFIRALQLLNETKAGGQMILPSECLVVEDSKEGILGAHRAGMKCLAVANSHPAAELGEADAVVKSLKEVTVPYLESLFQQAAGSQQ